MRTPAEEAETLNLLNPRQRREYLKKYYGAVHRESTTPRERVICSLAGKKPDRVPFDFWAVPEIYDSLKQYLGVSSVRGVEELLGSDCRKVEADYTGPAPEKNPDGSYIDRWGTHRREVKHSWGGAYQEYACFPLAEAETPGDVRNWPGWPRPEHWDYSRLPEKIAQINRKTRYHLRVELGGIFELSWGLYGLENFLIDLVERPEIPCAIMDCFTELFLALAGRVLEAAGNRIDIVYTYDDIGMQNNLLMSRAMWQKYILPRHRKLNKFIKQYPVKIMYHSCGAIYPLIPDLISEMEIDILNPLQPRAKGMDMEKIKENFGSRLAFHGGIDLQQTMPRGNTLEVQQEAESRCRVLGHNGGYICAPAHHLQSDTPLENIIALYTAQREV